MPGQGVAKPLEVRIRDYYLYSFILAFQVWGPFWILWEFSQLTITTADGVEPDTFRATLVDVSFWITLFLLSVPAGLLSDRYGRKPALLLGSGLWSGGLVLWGLAHDFPGFVASSVVWAGGAAFLFTVESAYLYDTLLEGGRAGEYARVASRGTLFAWTSEAGAAVVGGVLVTLTGAFNSVILLAGLVWLPAAVILLRFQEPRVAREVHPHFLQQLASGLTTVHRNRALRLVIAFQVITGFVSYLVYFFRQDLIGRLLEGNWFLQGVVFGGFFLVGGVAGLFAGSTLHRIGEVGSLMLVTLLIFPSIATMYFIPFFPRPLDVATGIGTQATFAVIAGLEAPILSTLINRRVASHERALIIGIAGFLATVVLAVFEPMAGLLAMEYNIEFALFVMAMLILIPAIYLVLAFRTALEAEVPTTLSMPAAAGPMK